MHTPTLPVVFELSSWKMITLLHLPSFFHPPKLAKVLVLTLVMGNYEQVKAQITNYRPLPNNRLKNSIITSLANLLPQPSDQKPLRPSVQIPDIPSSTQVDLTWVYS